MEKRFDVDGGVSGGTVPQQIILVHFLVSSCHFSYMPVNIHFTCTGDQFSFFNPLLAFNRGGHFTVVVVVTGVLRCSSCYRSVTLQYLSQECYTDDVMRQQHCMQHGAIGQSQAHKVQ